MDTSTALRPSPSQYGLLPSFFSSSSSALGGLEGPQKPEEAAYAKHRTLLRASLKELHSICFPRSRPGFAVPLVDLLEHAAIVVKQKAQEVASLEAELSLKLKSRALQNQLCKREQQSNASTPDLRPQPVPKAVCEAAVAAAQLIANEVSASSHQQRLLKLTFHTRPPSSSPQQFCKWFLGCDSARFLFSPLPPHPILDANSAFCSHLGLTRQLLTHSPVSMFLTPESVDNLQSVLQIFHSQSSDPTATDTYPLALTLSLRGFESITTLLLLLWPVYYEPHITLCHAIMVD